MKVMPSPSHPAPLVPGRRALLLASALCFVGAAQAAGGTKLTFNFDAGPEFGSTPFVQTSGGVSATVSATGRGYSLQRANVLGWTPKGFSGLIVYPNSIDASDLIFAFSHPLSTFSIKFAPEEYGCDSSATLQVQAWRGDILVGTATGQAKHPGTWPTGQLVFKSAKPFDTVVVHYLLPPPTGGDWGSIFLADMMKVTLAP